MAARFWVAQPVSGAADNGSGLIRLTVSSTTGMTTGDTRVVRNVGGTTEANGTWTITVVDATHIDLQSSTFTNAYTSGGVIDGRWDANNTNNWVSTSGGTNYGQTVPGSSDSVTLDGSSGGGTVTVNTTVTVQSITMSAFTGTLDFATNDNNVTLSAAAGLTNTGATANTLNMGDGTWTLTATGTVWNYATGKTLNSNGSTIVYSANTATLRSFAGAGYTYNNVTFDTNTTRGPINVTGSNIYNALIINSGNQIAFPASATSTVTSIDVNGTISHPVLLSNAGGASAATAFSQASGTPTFEWCFLSLISFGGGATFTANNSFQGPSVSSITVNNPSVGGGARVIGG